MSPFALNTRRPQHHFIVILNLCNIINSPQGMLNNLVAQVLKKKKKTYNVSRHIYAHVYLLMIMVYGMIP